MKKVFVYGTLKVGGRFSKLVAKFRHNSKSATTTGTMFSVSGDYPALILAGDTTILGELHEYDDEAFPILNRIEGYRGPNNPNNLYNLEEIEVTLTDGAKDRALVYTFAENTTNLSIVENGCWPI